MIDLISSILHNAGLTMRAYTWIPTAELLPSKALVLWTPPIVREATQ